MVYNRELGFTLIELVMALAIIGVFAFTGAFIMIYLIQNAIFIPQQLNTEMACQDALDIMIEGDGNARGLRFSRAITNVQDNQLVFINQDGHNISYRLDTANNMLYRSIAAGPESPLPYYLSNAIALNGKDNKLFTGYDASENPTIVPADVRRIRLNLIAQTGSGSFANWEGSCELASSVAVSRFQ